MKAYWEEQHSWYAKLYEGPPKDMAEIGFVLVYPKSTLMTIWQTNPETGARSELYVYGEEERREYMASDSVPKWFPVSPDYVELLPGTYRVVTRTGIWLCGRSVSYPGSSVTRSQCRDRGGVVFNKQDTWEKKILVEAGHIYRIEGLLREWEPPDMQMSNILRDRIIEAYQYPFNVAKSATTARHE